uniref:Transposase domain-containing protein n=1 Tax=Anopheles atroparvus TaxID=41427 RepID=A0AAG5DNQ2_ANOAO
MWYQGIENCLQHYYRNVTPEVDALHINLSMDGLPLHNSGPTQLWPILMQLHNIPETPIMIVGVFCGASKPTNCEDCLRPLVTELNHLQTAGVDLNGKLFGLRVRAIIADTPARAFIKGVAYHNAIEGCIKCKCIGQHVRSAHKVIFEGVCADPRTDAEFRSGAYTAHCKKSTPLLDLSYFDIVEDVIVSDRLHLLDLGIMKKLLRGWLNGTLAPYPKWGPEEPPQMSDVLTSIELPSEIPRKLRSLKFLAFWKGSELAIFLHYASIVVLKGRVTSSAYHHFKLLFVAVTLLSSAAYEQYWVYAGGLLERFVEEFGNVYHRNHLTSNVHNLLHVSAEVCRFGPLPTISTYPFESKLQRIKGLVRNGWRTLEQVVGRLTELREIDVARRNQRPKFPVLKFKNEEAILYVRSNFFLKRGKRNAWFLSNSNTIVKYFNASMVSDSVVVHGYPILVKKPQFMYPCSSELINCFIADLSNLSPTIITTAVSDIKCKLVAIERISEEGSEVYFTPLLHTLTPD